MSNITEKGVGVRKVNKCGMDYWNGPYDRIPFGSVLTKGLPASDVKRDYAK